MSATGIVSETGGSGGNRQREVPLPQHERRANSRRRVSRARTAGIAIVLATAAALPFLLCLDSGARADVTYYYNSDGELTVAGSNFTGQGVAYTYDSDGNIVAVAATTVPTVTPTATP